MHSFHLEQDTLDLQEQSLANLLTAASYSEAGPAGESKREAEARHEKAFLGYEIVCYEAERVWTQAEPWMCAQKPRGYRRAVHPEPTLAHVDENGTGSATAIERRLLGRSAYCSLAAPVGRIVAAAGRRRVVRPATPIVPPIMKGTSFILSSRQEKTRGGHFQNRRK